MERSPGPTGGNTAISEIPASSRLVDKGPFSLLQGPFSYTKNSVNQTPQGTIFPSLHEESFKKELDKSLS